MTSIIIGLLAALGIGGGIALSSHGGGGGGDGDSGYTEPVQPGKKPSIVSLLAAADKYQHIQSVSSDVGAPSIGDGIFTVTGERPILEDGKFQMDESDGEIEDLYEPYTTNISLDDYSHSDSYADYYQKKTFVTKGLYNKKEYSNEPDNWVELEQTSKDILSLGGQVLGLKDSEFGYHNNITVSSYGELPDYKTFYMYDDTKLASTARTDTASYKGNVLGYAEAEDSRTQEILGEDIQPLTGNINLNIDFANNILNGNINTKLSNKNWYSFNVSGNLNSVSDFSIGSISIDESHSPDATLSKYNMTNVYGYGNGKLLEEDKQNELVGQVYLRGENSNSYVNTDMSFGAIDTTIPQEEKPGEETPTKPTQGPIPDYSLISALSDSVQYTGVTIQKLGNYAWDYHLTSEKVGQTLTPTLNFQDQSIVLHTGQPKIKWNEFLRISLTEGDYTAYYGLDNEKKDIILNQQNKVSSSGQNKVNVYEKNTIWTAFYDKGYSGSGEANKEKITISQTDTVGLMGAILGLTVSDFGYWKESRSGSPFVTDTFSESAMFYVYDSNYLYRGGRTDKILLQGNIMNVYNVGNMDMELNFSTASLHGGYSLNGGTGKSTFVGNLNQYSLTLTGTELASNGVRLQGNGHLLEGANGLEAVGALYSGSSWFSFGLKEVK